MSVANPGPADRLRPEFAGAFSGIDRAAQRFVTGHSQRAHVAWTLGGFVLLAMVFDTVAFGPLDVHYDVSEALNWARHFAFGYKHPPLAAWIFGLWFAVFPRADWAVHLQAVTVILIALAVTWILLRDYLDQYRALLGMAALLLIPLYTIKSAELDTNTVMMPVWAAAVLFYLRARRGLGLVDAVLAGAFAALAVLGKYWAVYLLAGMGVASILGAGTRRFWRSPAPYLMALGAAVVIAPHVYWFVSERGGANYAFVRDSVMTTDTFGAALAKSADYLVGTVAYATGPFIVLAALWPSRAALADIVWPADEDRQQALILFTVPLLLPALANLAIPHRLTPDWTFPNWALLPVVLYSSRDIAVDATAVGRAGLLALAAFLIAILASPVIAYERLMSGGEPYRAHSRQVAELAEKLTGNTVRLFWGSPGIAGGLTFYLPKAAPLEVDPLSAEGRAKIGADGLVIVCQSDDSSCQSIATGFESDRVHTVSASFNRSFLGLVGPSMSFRLTVVPAQTGRDADPGDRPVGAAEH